MQKITVSFVILNWNGLDDTLECLKSLSQQTLDDYEIIVVDNGSSEDQKQVLRKLDDIVLVDLPVNNGFTGGQIEAFSRSSGEYIALVNNDSIIDRQWAEIAVKTLRDHKDAAAVGGRAYQWNEAKGESAYDAENDFYSYQVLNLVTGHAHTLNYGDVLGPVNSISGSGVLIKRSVIEEAGYFDNSFFAYYEETDLFARYKRLGYQILYNPSLRTWHKIAQSTKSNPSFYLYQMHRNRFLYAAHNYDQPYFRYFVKNYASDWLRSAARALKHRHKLDIEQKSILKAGWWNVLHIPGTLRSRRMIAKLGGTYSEMLLDDMSESISVVIPCYNYADHVGEAIESVLNQTLTPSEIIVINDGSSDSSLSVIKKYDGRVRIIDQKNAGVIATKNKGIKIARGEWVIFLDADDRMHKSYLKKSMDEARRHNADVVYSAMRFIGSESGIFTSRPYTLHSLRKGNYINNSALIRRQTLIDVGGYKQQMHFGFEDWELYMNIAEKGFHFRYIDQPLIDYRRHSENSRDSLAQNKLSNAKLEIKRLHPGLYSIKHRFIDTLQALLTIHQRRSPIRIAKDIRYLCITRLDKLSQNHMALNKTLGLLRMAARGDLRMIMQKTALNFRRLKRKISR